MDKEIKEVKIDNTAFNATHFADWSEANFINHELASVPDTYGDQDKKTEWLKQAHAEIVKANEVKEIVDAT